MLVEEKSYDYKNSRADEKNGSCGSSATKKFQSSVDRLLPGLSNQLESWMRIADEVSRPTPASSPDNLSSLTTPIAGKRVSGVPLYAVNTFASSLEKDLTRLVEGLQLELEQQVASAAVPACSLPRMERLVSAGVDSVAEADESTVEGSSKVASQASAAGAASASKSALVSTLHFLLAPLRFAFRSAFLWKKRDLALYLVVAVYLLMICVGFHYFSYTPVCVLFGLFGPKSKAGRFMQTKWDSSVLFTAPDGTPTLSKSATRQGARAEGAEATAMQKMRDAILGEYKLNIFMCMYIGIMHVMSLHAIFVLAFCGGRDYFINMVGEAAPPVKWETLLFASLLWPVSGLGITAGAHRLWAHKSYSAHFALRLFLMLCNSVANQGSIYHWARDHRTHHLHSDKPSDPHDRNRGFFYAHMGWLLVKKPAAVVEAGRAVDISDLKRDGLVMFQKSADPWWNFMWSFAIPGFVSVYLWGDTLWNGFLFAGVLRYVYVLHCTWAVNSIVHSDWFGNPSPYDEDAPPSESRLVSFLALGEGWHSWHHAFPFDYAASELGSLEQYNPTKLFLDSCALLGLVWNRKTGQRMWAEKKKRLLKARAEEMKEDVENVECVEELEGPPVWKMRKLTYRRRGADPARRGQALSVSAGHLDTIASIEEWEKTANVTKDKVMAMIPPELKKRVWWKSTLYLLRASGYSVLAAVAFRYLQHLEVGAISVPGLLESSTFHALFWGIYAAVQGTLLTGLWVIGHECGHGAYSESAMLNDAVGFVVHTLLLVPYFAWQFTHGKHHKYTNHLTKGESHVPLAKPTVVHKLLQAARSIPGAEDLVATPIGLALQLVFGWPLYLLLNVTGGRTNWKQERLNKGAVITHFFAGSDSQLFPPVWRARVNISAVAFLCMVGGLAVWSDTYGSGHMLKWYFFPYLVTNAWLVLYTYLHHTHEGVPHFGDESFNFLRGALCTIDRPYPGIINHVHLHIGSTHVLHHLNSRIPHYHAEAATEILKDRLGPLYRYDDRGIVSALWGTFKTCHYVEGVAGLQFFRTYGAERKQKSS